MSTWVLLLLVLIYSETAAMRRQRERELKRAEAERKEAERRRMEEENQRVMQEQKKQRQEWEAKEKAFWNEWNAPTEPGAVDSWQDIFVKGPWDFDDEYYDKFDEYFGPDWRRYLRVPPKGENPPSWVQFQPRKPLAEMVPALNECRATGGE